MKIATIIIIGLSLASCSDSKTETPTNSSGSISSGGLGSFNYVDDMAELIEEGNGVIADFNDLASVWDATKNTEYAAAQTTILLSQTRNLLTSARRLTPPSRYRDAHQLFLDMYTALESSLSHFHIHVTATDPSLRDSSILNANIELRRAIRLKDQFNEAIES